jgi:serine protease Do
MKSVMKSHPRMAVAGGLLMMLLAGAAWAQPKMVPASFADVAAKVAPAVVNISTVRLVRQVAPAEGFMDPWTQDFFDQFYGQQPDRYYAQPSLGTGVVIDKRGFILTNNHVVAKASEIVVKFKDGKEVKAEVVGSDPTTDLAVIRVRGGDNWPAAELGDSDQIRVGDWVIAVGSPFGLEQTVTSGIISAKGRTIGQGPYDDFLQTDASINPGNSGGPLVNMDGQVIGINTAIFSNSGGSMGIGFAVPISMAAKVYGDLVKTGSVHRGWLGVVIQPMTRELAQHFKLKDTEGVLVSALISGGPAERAGLKAGDVILAINGKTIGAPNELSRSVAQLQPGQTAGLNVLREGEPLEIKVRMGDQMLAQKEGGKVRGGTPSARKPVSSSILGVQVDNLTPQTAQQLGTDDLAGVVVTAVETGGAAEGAGLQPGDVIRELNRQRIRNQSDYGNILRALRPGADLLILIERNGYAIYIAMKIPRR